MSGGIAGGIAECWAERTFQGSRLRLAGAAVDAFVIMEYGIRIPDVAAQIQESIKNAIERMTGLVVVEVNVNVQGVAFGAEAREEEHRVR